MVESGSEGAGHGLDAGVLTRPASEPVAHVALVAAVVPANHAVLIGQQLGGEAAERHAQVGPLNVIGRKAGEPGVFLNNLAAFACVQRTAAEQGGVVFAAGELLGP